MNNAASSSPVKALDEDHDSTTAVRHTNPLIRLGAFAGIFAAMALWELLAPRRHQAIGRGRRWPSNLGVVVLDTLLVRLLFPTAAVGMALLAEAQGWGLFHALDAAGLARDRRRR